MKHILLLILISVGISVQAQSYKCEQENGQHLYSDTPCVVTKKEVKNIITDANGSVIYLATDPKPVPLPSHVVNDLFTAIETSCQAQDGDTLLNQYSQAMQEDIKLRIGRKSAFELVSYICGSMEDIKAEIAKSSEQTLFASKMPNNATLLCFYKATTGLERCIGNIQITVEQNKLKLNGY